MILARRDNTIHNGHKSPGSLRLEHVFSPPLRGKGYGTQMLRFALEKARALGIERALVTCDDNNIASARVIENNGGKLADKVKPPSV